MTTYQYFELICGRPDTSPVPGNGDPQSLSDALEDVFSSESGLLVMQWNGLFVPLSYKYDVSWMTRDAIGMVEQLMDGAHEVEVNFPSSGFNADWRVLVEGDRVVVHAEWRDVVGSLLDLLRDRSPLTYDRDAFVAEWQNLFSVVQTAIDFAGLDRALVYDYDRLEQLALSKRNEPQSDD